MLKTRWIVVRVALALLILLITVSMSRAAASATNPATAPSALKAARHVKLPDSVSEVGVGGGGKYLILHLQKLKQLALFDVEKAKVVKYLPMPDGDLVFAAGAKKLYVGLKALRQIQRWDLAEGKLELTVAAPEGGIGAIAIGADSVGPLVLLGDNSKRCWLLDPRTMQATQFPSKNWGNDGAAWGPVHIHASFDGSAVVACGGGWAGLELTEFAAGKPVNSIAGGYATQDTLISGNGSLVFPDSNTIERSDLASKVNGIEGTIVPAIDPSYSLAIRKDNATATLTLFSNLDPRPLLTLRDLPELADNSKLPMWQRVSLIPSAKSLVTVATDELIVRKFDLAEELDAGGIDYLFVESSAPATVARGESLIYQVKVRAKKGGVKYDLQASPPGMTLGIDGKLQWDVPKDFADATTSVIIQIADAAEQTIFQSFVLRVTASAPGSGTSPTTSAAAPDPSPAGSSGPNKLRRKPRERPERPDAAAGAPADAAAAGDRTVVKLDEAFHEFHAADFGRALVFYQQAARKLVVYDTATGKQRGVIPVSADDARFACGSDCIIVVLPTQKIVLRYDLKTLQRQKVAPIPASLQFKDVRMGDASTGPIFLSCAGQIVALDASTLAPLKLRGELPTTDPQGAMEFRVSADGSCFVSWDGSGQVAYTITHVRSGVATSTKSPMGWDRGGRQFTPDADGSLVIYGKTFDDGMAKRFADDSALPSLHDVMNFVPTSDPRFLFAVYDSGHHMSRVALCARTDRRVLIEMPGLPDVGNNAGYDGLRCGIVFLAPVSGEPRLIYLPTEKVVAAVPVEADRFEVFAVDVSALMARGASGVDPHPAPAGAGPSSIAAATSLAVISVPPPQVSATGAYTYPLQVLPESASVKYKLDDGPPGMTISVDGVIQWKPTDRPIGGKVSVIVSIADAAGAEVPHSFDIEVVRNAPPIADGGKDPAVRGHDTPPGAVTAPVPESKAPAIGIVKADAHRIELPSTDCQFVQGSEGHVLVLAGKQLAILAGDGFTIIANKTLPKAYVAIAEREHYYVAISPEPASIDLLNKKSLEITRKQPVGLGALTGLVLHPTRPISYVCYTQRGKGFTHRYLMFDESTGNARVDDNWIGAWLGIAPDGGFLVAGTQEIYQDGHDIIDNPDRSWVVPRYASLDTIARYDLSEATGTPLRVAHKEGIGGGGLGIRLSPDGKRFVYLSNVGSPSGSRNLSAWDPLDLSQLPVPYITKDVATSHDLAFHPMLPLAASFGKDGPVFYNSMTGESVDSRIDQEIADKTITHIYFSPDGRNVILQTAVGPISYLYHVPLKLSAEELKVVARLPRPDRKVQPLPPTEAAPAEPHKLPESRAEVPSASIPAG